MRFFFSHQGILCKTRPKSKLNKSNLWWGKGVLKEKCVWRGARKIRCVEWGGEENKRWIKKRTFC